MAEFLVYHFLLTVLPAFCFLYFPTLRPYSFLWLGCWVFTLQTCVLFIHYTTHVNIWKPKYKFIQRYVDWVLCPMVGLPFNLYEEHHTKMHHGANNSYPGDLSGTECYERDNIFHWMLYWWRHLFLALIEVPLWSFRHGRYKEGIKETFGGIAFIGLHAYHVYVSPNTGIYMGVGPFVFTTAAFMFGNFSQHCLVNPKNARSSYGLSYNVINAKINLGFWNDGYHLMHHLNSQIPWHSLPKEFLKQQEKIARNGGLTFENCTFQFVFLWGLFKQYDKLHEHFVPLCEKQDMTLEEFKKFIDPWYTPVFDKSLPPTLFTNLLKATSTREPIYIDYGRPKGEKKM